MKRTNLRGSYFLTAALLTCSVLVLHVQSIHAQQPANVTAARFQAFECSAELVSLDAAGHTVTVNVRVPVEEAFPAFEHLKSGDRIILTWSGIEKYSDGVRSVARYDAAKTRTGHFMIPAEFVSFDGSRHVATVKLQIPASDVSKIQPLKPGEWITATSPHGKMAATEPITMIRPYVHSEPLR